MQIELIRGEGGIPGILKLGILFLGIVFPNMCILGCLIDGLNFRKFFVHFLKYPWQSSIQRWLAVFRSRSVVVDSGQRQTVMVQPWSVVVRWQ